MDFPGTGAHAVAYRKCMRQRLFLFAGVLGVTILLASWPSAFAQSSTITTDTWALAGGTIYVSPAEAPILNMSSLLLIGVYNSERLPEPASNEACVETRMMLGCFRLRPKKICGSAWPTRWSYRA